MAIVVKNAMSGLGAIKKIGIHQSLYDKLHASDIHIKLSASSFDFIVAGVRRRMIWNSRADFVADGLGSSGSGYAA